jgi:hypothetical protein
MLNMNNNSRNNPQCYRCGQFGHLYELNFIFLLRNYPRYFFCFLSSARDCSISIENNGAPIPGVSNGFMNDRSLFVFLKLLSR